LRKGTVGGGDEKEKIGGKTGFSWEGPCPWSGGGGGKLVAGKNTFHFQQKSEEFLGRKRVSLTVSKEFSRQGKKRKSLLKKKKKREDWLNGTKNCPKWE